MFGARYFGNRYFGSRFYGGGGVPVPGYYWGDNYFSNRYFGNTYFGSRAGVLFSTAVTTGLELTGTLTAAATTESLTTFVATQSSGIALTGSMAINATPLVVSDTDFVAGAPLELSLASGSLTLSGTSIVLGYGSVVGRSSYFGGRFWGQRHFGKAYWGTGLQFSAEQTTGVALTGTTTLAATPVQVLSAAISSGISISGTVELSVASTSLSTAPAQQPAGRSKSGRVVNRRKAIIKIDDEEFVVNSEEEVYALVEAAKKAAEESAEAQAKEIVAKRNKKARKGTLNTSPFRLVEPKISVGSLDDESGDLDWLKSIEADLAPIREAYQSVADKYEISLLLNHKAQLDEEDALVALLLTI